MIYGPYAWCGAFRRRQSAIQHISPDDVFLPRRYAYLDEVAVVESFRGQGVGRLLMAGAHEWIAAQGVKEIELNVWELNTGAIAFYKELGYQPLRRGLRFILD